MSKLTKVDALDLTKDCYLKYGQYVNTHRAFPKVEDGLKIVQRLLMYTTSKMSDKNQKCASIVGECMSHYHPHSGESMYSALVKLINSDVSPFIGQGNFGSNSGLIRTGPAAQRYTGAKLSDFGKEFLKLVKFSKFYENDLANQEPEYIPTPIPFALLNGDSGIGVGSITSIPQFNKKSLINSVKAILKDENKIPDVIPHVANGEVIITEEELRQINDTGYGSFTVRALIDQEYSEEDRKDVVVIKGLPDKISPDRLFAVFRSEIENDEIEIRDESSETTRILIVRKPKLKNFTESILRQKVEKATSKRVNCNIVVSFGDHVRRITPNEWLKISISNCLVSYSSYLEDEKFKLSLEIKFHKIKDQLVKLLQDDSVSESTIKSKLDLTDYEYSNYTSRSLRQLRKDKDISDLEKSLLSITDKLSNLNISYLNDSFKTIENLLK